VNDFRSPLRLITGGLIQVSAQWYHVRLGEDGREGIERWSICKRDRTVPVVQEQTIDRTLIIPCGSRYQA